MKIEKAVLRETAYVAIGTVALSCVMEAVFLLLKLWEPAVLFGNLLGALAAILNFFLMGLGIQKIVSSGTDKPENKVRLYMTLRMFMVAAFLVIGGVVPCFNLFAVVIPLFFPQITIFVQKFLLKDKNSAETGISAPEKVSGEETAAEESGPSQEV